MLEAVDFYILSDNTAHASDITACRLTEKAWQAGLQVFIYTSSPEATDRMNSLLWTFRQNSFVPHCPQIGGEKNCPDDPVVIGGNPQSCQGRDVLINLSDILPEQPFNTRRIIEIIPVQEPLRSHGRERFKQYRALGCEPVTHQV